jgi:cytochrome c biogenesis protein CcdA/thiol-disulfide isomerase/thioredoxin
MIVLALAFLGGVLTILSPCILPVIPLVFARAGRSFGREIAPMLGGLAIAFTGAALIATATAHWLLVANAIGRDLALLLLAIVAVTLLSARAAEWVARPLTSGAASALAANDGGLATPLRNVAIGVAIGLLWAPCAGPILGLLIAAAASSSAPRAGLLFLTFAIGAIMSLAMVIALGSRLIDRVKRAGAADVIVRRTLGVATLVTVVAIFAGWDQAIFAKGGVSTTNAEEALVSRLAPGAVPKPIAGSESIDAFAAEEHALDAMIALPTRRDNLPGFPGATEWINSPALTPESLKGKVVLVDFWTFECYNCLNALPHVKDLYAKYKDRGFVVVGVHTPELAAERVPASVRAQVKKLGITYPVVIDNDMTIWRAFQNQYWPAAYYADATGKVRFYHFGEGQYDEQDKAVAKLLAERDAGVTTGDR